MRRSKGVALGLLLTVLLSGCWSRVELNDLGVVTGIAVDLGEQEAVKLTLYFARSTGGGQNRGRAQARVDPFGVLAREGPDLLEAMRRISLATPRRISLHHVRIVLIGEEVARSGVADLMDFVARHPQVRLLASAMVVQGKAAEVLETPPHLETLQPENIFDIIEAKGAKEQRLKEFLIARSSRTHSGWMYALRVVDRPAVEHPEAPTRAAEVAGAALFLGDHTVAFLDPQQVRPLIWLLQSPRDMFLRGACPDNDGKSFSARVSEVKRTIGPSVKSGRPSFQVHVLMTTELWRSECPEQVQKGAERDRLEVVLSAKLKEEVTRFIRTTQEAGVDPVGFGHHLMLAQPQFWKRIEPQWVDIWKSQAEVRVSTEVRIHLPGLLIKSATKTEEELKE